MLIFVFVAIFIAGLMVGRTPEYLGKKIEARDVKLAALSLLVTAVFTLGRHGLGGVSRLGAGRAQQRRPTRIQRDALRLRIRRRETTARRSPDLR